MHPMRLAGMLIAIAIAGPLLWSLRWEWPYISDPDFVVSATAFSIGVVAFCGIVELNRSAGGGKMLGDENLRTAIAGSLVLAYLFIVCFTAFVRTSDKAGAVTKEFMQSFSQVIGVTIAFYFGATAATQIFARRSGDDPDRRGEGKS